MILAIILTMGLYGNFIDIQSEIYESRIETEQQLNIEKDITCFDEFIEAEVPEENKTIFTKDFKETLATKCLETGIDPWLVLAIINNESRFNPNARAYDGSGHYGLMQLSEKYFGDEIKLTESQDIFEPVANITVGIDNLHSIEEKIKYYDCLKTSDIKYPLESLIVLSHNKGLGDAVPLFKSGNTNSFTKEVISDYEHYKKTYGEIDLAEEISDIGFWIKLNTHYVCSDCNEILDVVEINGIPIYRYCPFCGKEKNIDYKKGD